MNRKRVVCTAAAILALLILLFPVHVTCGAPDYACATAPDQNGIFHTYYEVEPLGVMMLETIMHTNLPLFYWSGNEGHPVNPQ